MATTQERLDQQTPIIAPESEKHRSLRADVWRQFRRHKGAMAGLVVLTLIMIASFIGPFIWQGDAYTTNPAEGSLPPSLEHPMGTDNLGRDVLARVLIGGRISLTVGFTAMLVGLILGTAIGILSGFFKKLDEPLMRVTDLFLALPILPLLLVVIMLFRKPLTEALGPETGIFILVVVIIGATSWMATTRVVRGEVLSLKQDEFVLAAHSIGTRKRNVIFRHILPNTMSPVIVAAALGIAGAIITESALSFLGLGFPSTFPTWGRLLYDAKDYLQITPMRVLWPGVMISLTVLSVNYIGDGLRDALDPKLRSK
jgi:peptide/nickel transport system permease protein